MLKKLQQNLKGERGFTLIELVIVLAILGLLIALALPTYLGARAVAAKDEARVYGQQWRTLEWACALSLSGNQSLSGACGNDNMTGFSDKASHWNLAATTAGGNSNSYVIVSASAFTEVVRCWPGSTGDPFVGTNTYMIELMLSGTGGATAGTAGNGLNAGQAADVVTGTLTTCPSGF